jgi:hypothetical protein
MPLQVHRGVEAESFNVWDIWRNNAAAAEIVAPQGSDLAPTDRRTWMSYKRRLLARYEDAAEQVRLLADKKTELRQ